MPKFISHAGVLVTTDAVGQPEVVAPPFASVQSELPVPDTVPAVNTFVSVP